MLATIRPGVAPRGAALLAAQRWMPILLRYRHMYNRQASPAARRSGMRPAIPDVMPEGDETGTFFLASSTEHDNAQSHLPLAASKRCLNMFSLPGLQTTTDVVRDGGTV